MKRQNFKVLIFFLFPPLFLKVWSVLFMYRHPSFSFFKLLVLLLIVQGTISFGLGFFFVVIGWPIFGMILETYGFIVLFRSIRIFHAFIFIHLLHIIQVANGIFMCSGFWPTLAVFIQRIPILGWVFQLPLVRSVCLFLDSNYSLSTVRFLVRDCK